MTVVLRAWDNVKILVESFIQIVELGHLHTVMYMAYTHFCTRPGSLRAIGLLNHANKIMTTILLRYQCEENPCDSIPDQKLFGPASSFNADISKWDVSSVADMKSMFSEVTTFDVDLCDWDVSRVTDMSRMFFSARFNSDLSKWDVSRVECG